MRGCGPSGVDPATGVALPSRRGHPERRAGLDQRCLERPDEGAKEQPAVGELDDRVRDELAGPVVGHLASALDADELDAAGIEQRRRGEDVSVVGAPAKREDGRVLEQQEPVADAVLGARASEPPSGDPRRPDSRSGPASAR